VIRCAFLLTFVFLVASAKYRLEYECEFQPGYPQEETINSHNVRRTGERTRDSCLKQCVKHFVDTDEKYSVVVYGPKLCLCSNVKRERQARLLATGSIKLENMDTIEHCYPQMTVMHNHNE